MSLTESSPHEVAKIASTSAQQLAALPSVSRSHALDALHAALTTHKASILQANAKDIEAATKAAKDGKLSQSIVKRLDLNRPGKYEDMLQSILDVRDLEDPSKTKCYSALL